MNVGKLFNTLNVRLDDLAKIIRGRGGGKPWEEYVQDGLIFQLDCENKWIKDAIFPSDPPVSTKKWDSVVGNCSFRINPYATEIGKEISFEGKNGIVFTPYLGNVALFDYEGTFDLDENKDYYIEVCCKYDDVRDIAGNDDNLLNIAFSGLEIHLQTTLSSTHGLVQTNSFGDKRTSRLNYVEAEVPTMYGEVITLASSIDGMNLNTNPIVSSNGNYGYAGDLVCILGKVTLYSIRVYDKSIIDEQSVMMINYSIDQKRFAAPPVPENALVDVDDNYILDAEENFIIDNN